MNCRIMKKEEFVQRMLADQELRKARKSEALRNVKDYYWERDLKYRRKHNLNNAFRLANHGKR